MQNLQLAEEVLNDLHQQKTKILLKGLTHKAYKPEEKEQKLSAAEGDVHREFKKQKMNYSEDRLCKNLLDHHVVKKKKAQARIFIPDASRFLPGEKRCCLVETGIADSKAKDGCASGVSEIKQSGRS